MGVNLLALRMLVILWLSRTRRTTLEPADGVEQIVGPETIESSSARLVLHEKMED